MFSSRVRQAAGRNRLALALDRRRADGDPIVDLTLSNPTRAGIPYPSGLLASLASDRSLSYDPEPFGTPSARQAVSDDLARRGLAVPAHRTVLTASTSEAYSLLFKLLCDPGDAVLAPRPSYPLIEHLTDLDGISLEHYRLEFHGRWELDRQDVREKAGSRRTRAIIMINPNNPTGSVVTDAELDVLASLARDRDLALISDEVFADYSMSGAPLVSALRQETALTFALGGLSKSLGLPQVKLGWIAVGGPAALVTDALERLETICDAYLSVSTPVQVAAPELLAAGASVRTRIQERVRENFAQLQTLASASPACAVLPSEAGWYAVVQVPAIASEETIVLDLLEQTGVLVHPGYFFDFEREAFLVLSLLPEPRMFAAAARALFGRIGARP
ncbi:MAG TPA: pyridoxal phosphate-dependent aminotransferase [Vicinamibacterales bacterium]|nr:pyridoxal phosphate-dependent aminotransferase [Vicinamibacterales bacterium]